MPEQFLYFALMKKFKSVKNREVIEGYEYDIFVEDLNLLIEYDGVLYHKILKDNNKREIEKEQLAYERGYSFIRVEECKLKGDEAIFDNVIRYNYRGRSKVMNRMFSNLATMINEKFGTDIDPILPEGTLEEAKEHALKNRKLKSIAYTHPEIVAKAWDYEKNGNIKPTQYSHGSEATPWWKCEKGIRESYQTTVSNKVRLKSKCPHCMGNHPKKVYQYDAKGKLLNTYSSIGEARRATNFSSVTAYAKSNRVTSHGFVFSHEKLEPNLFKQLSN
jgi:very-short-patch-repair endonuclease